MRFQELILVGVELVKCQYSFNKPFLRLSGCVGMAVIRPQRSFTAKITEDGKTLTLYEEYRAYNQNISHEMTLVRD